MNKHILRTVLGLDEAVTLCGVEPLHGSNCHRSSFRDKIATTRRRAEGQTSARCGEQVRRSITSLGEQAEPPEVDKLRHKRSKLVLQLGSTSHFGFGWLCGLRQRARRRDDARQCAKQVRHLERLAEAGAR